MLESVKMSSYFKFDEKDPNVDITDTSTGFSNPGYSEQNGATLPVSQNGEATKESPPARNGKALSRSSSFGQDPDQIEVSLEEGNGTPTDEVLQRAAGFFVDNNDNYKVSWEEASHMISDADEDPSKPPVPGINKEYIRWKLRRVIESIYFRFATLLFIVIDLIIVIIDLSLGHGSPQGLKVADFLFSLYFVFEVSLRLGVLGLSSFFYHWYNVLDIAREGREGQEL